MTGTYEEDVRVFEHREAGDNKVIARFYIHPRENEAASAEAGRPIFKDMEYVEIMAPGNLNNIVRRPASEADKQRFPGAYRAFKAGLGDYVEGTPLTEVMWITKSQAAELSYHGIRSLEHLAEVADTVCVKIPGLMTLREKARKYLEVSKDTARFTKLEKENEDLKNQIASLTEAVKDQTRIINELKTKKD